MNKDQLDRLAEKLITFIPIMTKKIIRIDMQVNPIMPVNQLMVLTILCDEGTLSVSEVCKKVFISKPQMTIILDKLVKEDLVTRISSEKDRRIINISLTDKGKLYCCELLEIFKKNLRVKLESLSKEDLTKLLDSMEIVQNVLKQLE